MFHREIKSFQPILSTIDKPEKFINETGIRKDGRRVGQFRNICNKKIICQLTPSKI